MERTKTLQVRVTEMEWKFIRRLAIEKNTTVSDIFRWYIKYLKDGGKLVEYIEERR